MSFLSGIFYGKQSQDLIEPANEIWKYFSKYIAVGSKISLIDIGAHNGGFVDELSKYYTITNAILAEPIPHLSLNLKIKYAPKKYEVYQNAFTDKDGEQIEFLINEFAETSSLLKIHAELEELADVKVNLVEKLSLTTRSLDAVISETSFGQVDILKIDVQGAEHLVIKGAAKALQQTRFVCTEVSFKPLYEGSSVFQDIFTLMEANGFILLELSPGHRTSKQELLQVDALFVNKSKL